jgi:hypothetical protein
VNILDAHNQWSTRPADERFWDIADALVTARYIKDNSREIPGIPRARLGVRATSGEVVLETGRETFHLSNSAAQQLCSFGRVPYTFVSKQPAELAARNIAWGLENEGVEQALPCELLVYNGERQLVRAITSERYERCFNAEYLTSLSEHLDPSWRTPPARPVEADPRSRPATADDIRGIEGLTSIKIGEMIAPAGVYLSDRDMFVFVVSRQAIQGPTGPLARFALFWNNEVGTGSGGFTLGYFDHVCGNHIIWGASGVKEFRFRHVGKQIFSHGRAVRSELAACYDDGSKDEALLQRAATKRLGTGESEVVQNVVEFGRKKRIGDLTEKRVTAGYRQALTAGRYGDPNTAWSVVSGLTELSQATKWGNERIALDRAAARILEMAE